MKKSNRYFFLRMFAFLQDFIFSFVGMLIPRENRIIFNSSHNNHFTFNSRYLFLYYLENFSHVDVKFVINDKKLREVLTKEYGSFFIDSQTIKNKILILRSKVWVTSTMETPLFGFFYNFNRFVIHLSHGVVFKSAGIAERKPGVLKRIYYLICRTNFSQYLVPSRNLIEVTSKVYGEKNKSKFLIEGFPRNDIMKPCVRKSRKILYAPTWRKTGNIRPLPCLPKEEETLDQILELLDAKLYIRHHPLYETDIEFSRFKNIFSFGTKECSDINEKLHEFKVLITDYSSLFFDSLFIDQSICFYPYDFDAYSQRVGFLLDYNSNIPGPKFDSLKDLKELLKESLELKGNNDTSPSRFKKFFFENSDRESSKRLANLINSYLL